MTLGKGFLSSRSSSSTVRALNSQAATTWFYEHIYNLARGQQKPVPFGARKGLARHYRREIQLARKRAKP